MNKENNKNILIADLTAENDNLRAQIVYYKQMAEGYEQYINGTALQNPLILEEKIAEVEKIREEYQVALKEVQMMKAQIENEYRNQFEEILHPTEE